MSFSAARNVSNPLRVAVIGTGYFSRFHYGAWQRMPDVQLVGILALDKAEAVRFQNEFGVEAIYDDLQTMLDKSDADLIDIVTPPHTHAGFIHQCIENKTAVICQKPFCNSANEAASLVKQVNANQAFVAVHENFRFQPWYQHIKQIIDAGTLGEIFEINFNFRPGDGQGANAYMDRQPYFQTQDRFFIQETGIHFIDVFRYLLGDITGLFARLSKLNPAITGEDAGVVFMDFANGARGVLNGNRLSDHAATNTRLTMGEMRLEGSNGTLALNGDGQVHMRLHGSIEWIASEFDWQDNDFGGDCVYNTQRHVVDHLVNNAPIQNSAQDYLINRQIEDAIYQSAEHGRWVELQTD